MLISTSMAPSRWSVHFTGVPRYARHKEAVNLCQNVGNSAYSELERKKDPTQTLTHTQLLLFVETTESVSQNCVYYVGFFPPFL